MTVKELKEALAAYPDDMEVLGSFFIPKPKKKSKRMCLRDKSKICNLCHECDIDSDLWHSLYSR